MIFLDMSCTIVTLKSVVVLGTCSCNILINLYHFIISLYRFSSSILIYVKALTKYRIVAENVKLEKKVCIRKLITESLEIYKHLNNLNVPVCLNIILEIHFNVIKKLNFGFMYFCQCFCAHFSFLFNLKQFYFSWKFNDCIFVYKIKIYNNIYIVPDLLSRS